MRYVLFSIFLMLVFFVFCSESAAETVTVGFTESVVNTAGGDPPLQHCTIYRSKGATGTDWHPIKIVAISDVDGGGVRSEDVVVPLTASELPVSYRFAYACTTVNGNESPLHIPNTSAGNPITFQGS